MRLGALVLVVAACGGPRYLGERLPDACRAQYVRCDGELRLVRWRDEVGRDAALERYVGSVEARIVRASTLDYLPAILVIPEGDAAVVGHSIIVGRTMVVKLGTEAELAAILAHETAHLEAKLGDTSYLGSGIDEEGVADERGLELLVRAGYPAAAMPSALERVLVEDDPWHPPKPTRIQHTTVLAGDHASDDDRTRAPLLAAIDGARASNTESGKHVGELWIDADRDLVVPPPPGAKLEETDAHATAYIGPRRYGAWRLGRAEGRELADRLVVVKRLELAIGHVTIGTAAKRAELGSSLDRLLAARRSDAGDVDPNEVGAVIESRDGAVLVAISGGTVEQLEQWLHHMRLPTGAERDGVRSPRVTLVHASKTATVRELVATCADPKRALELDDPDREIRAGELFKCTTVR